VEARLERVGQHAVADRLAGQTAAYIRIESRPVRQRQHFGVAHVEHDHRTGLRRMLVDRGTQRRVRDELDPAVERQG
jgi:hypothetical protein